jgi:hypothetical protein
MDCDLRAVILPATVTEIDPDAFGSEIWPLVQFDGPPLLFLKGDFLYSADSRILSKSFSRADPVEIPAGIEVLGPDACTGSSFEFGRLHIVKPIQPKTFIIPRSVETIGDRCFEGCSRMETIMFADSSKLKRIGERAFAKSALGSIRIPASTEEIDGSAFVGCPLETIEIALDSRNFVLENDLLLRSEGTEIVRYFGRELDVKVGAKVELLGKSCFEKCEQVERVIFDNGSQLRRISRSALSHCDSLRSIWIPASVEIIEEAAFKGCSGLESCLIDENANLRRIGRETFSECCALRTFSIPGKVEMIGENCFSKCVSLRRLRFESGDSLKRLLSDSTLAEVLAKLGLEEMLSLIEIEITDGGSDVNFEGWSSVVDGGSCFALIQDIA